MKLVYVLLSLVIFSFGIIYAESNGVWLDAQDLSEGIFGFDEFKIRKVAK